MKRRAFLFQSGAGLAAAALPSLAQVPGTQKDGAVQHPEPAAIGNGNAARRRIVHPGILQTRADLEFMKAKVKAREEPWKSAWDRLQAEPNSSLDFKPTPFAHIIRGAYGAGQKGGAELSASAAAVEHRHHWDLGIGNGLVHPGRHHLAGGRGPGVLRAVRRDPGRPDLRAGQWGADGGSEQHLYARVDHVRRAAGALDVGAALAVCREG